MRRERMAFPGGEGYIFQTDPILFWSFLTA
jgi:hypothetical protein